MSRLDVDTLARAYHALTTRRAALGLGAGLWAALGDHAALGGKKCKKKKDLRCGVNMHKLKDEKGCWRCCPEGTNVACIFGNCCNSAVAFCCNASKVCRANGQSCPI